jgi:hypothetical protein
VLKTTHIYSFTILDARGLKLVPLGVDRAALPLKVLVENVSLPFLVYKAAFLHSLAHGPLLSTSKHSLFKSLFSSHDLFFCSQIFLCHLS